MGRIIHISDLHFGRVNPALIDPLLTIINQQQPNVIAVSGDLTQRATREQFEEARRFLDRIPFPKVVVPGNHDISLWNVYRRFARPLDRYRRHIGEELEPIYVDDRMFVLGLNTARSLTWKNGRISVSQVERIRERLCAADPRFFKVLVMHHPFVPPEGAQDWEAVGRVEMAMEALEHCGADLILAGHLHLGYSRQTSSFYSMAKHSILVVQSGTTLSARTRAERNSFNVIDVEPDAATITIYVWEPTQHLFLPRHPVRYEKRGEWRRAEQQQEAGGRS